MDELRCRFLGVAMGDETVDDEVAAAAAGGSFAGGDGFIGGESTGSGEEMGPFLDGFKMVIKGGWISEVVW